MRTEKSKNQIQVFSNTEFGEIRTVQIDGEQWWVLKDVCNALAISNVTMTAKRLDTDEKAELSLTEVSSNGIRQNRKRLVISESGLYAVILRSDKPNAQAFRKWLTSEVIPAIRKTGCYVTDELHKRLAASEEVANKFWHELKTERNQKNALEQKFAFLKEDYIGVLSENSDLIEKRNELENEVLDLEDEIVEMLPCVEYCENILQCEDVIPVTVIASSYGLTAATFNSILHDLKVQRKVGGTWVLYAKYANNGFTVLRTYQIGNKCSVRHTYWTEKGRHFLYEILKFYGLLPEIERS